MTGVVIDACVMPPFLNSLITGVPSDAKHLMDCVAAGDGFAIDAGDKIINQWKETCRHLLIEDWIIQGIQAGNIRMVSSDMAPNHKKHLRINLGFPFTVRHEGVYIEVAHTAPPHVIVSSDIDFWEPKAKKRRLPSNRRLCRPVLVPSVHT